MGDNVAITPDRSGTGTIIATDEITIGGVVVEAQRQKIVLGKDGEYTGDLGGRNVDGDANRSALYSDPRVLAKRIAVTPAISTTPAYTAKDAVGGLLTFANAARAANGSVVVQSLQIVDLGQQMAALDLILFNQAVTAPTDNAIFNPADADLGKIVGVVSIASGNTVWSDFSTNSVVSVNNIGLEAVLVGTDLCGVLVARGTPTYTSVADLVVSITVLQD